MTDWVNLRVWHKAQSVLGLLSQRKRREDDAMLSWSRECISCDSVGSDVIVSQMLV